MRSDSAKILNISIVGDEVLRKVVSPIKVFDKNLETLVVDMIATMYKANGIGLAAPQVGRSLSLCVIDVSSCVEKNETCRFDGKTVKVRNISPLVLINPRVTKFSKDIVIEEEGCLSVPKFRGEVARPKAITVKFFDVLNKPHEMMCDGILARCAQHEIDHLGGVLFIDKVVKN